MSVPPTTGLPATQTKLVLHGIGQRYHLDANAQIPSPHEDDEFLLRAEYIGLNPIDWKAPDFGFGIPALPFIPGREAYGSVITLPRQPSRLRIGDSFAFVSTDYRDPRKATCQRYIVAKSSNVIGIPPHVSPAEASAFGVAAVTATLALGVCGGLSFAEVANGPDLLDIVQNIDESRLASDVRAECRHGITRRERLSSGDWVAIWGASSTCAFVMNQLARLAGLRTILVIDTAKHGRHLTDEPAYKADLVVDSKNPTRAIEIVRAVTLGSLRFGIDCVGKTTAAQLLQCLASVSADDRARLVSSTRSDSGSSTPSSSPPSPADSAVAPLDAHLIGLTGVPKETGDVHSHNVPVKIFHEIDEVGQEIVLWLERLLSVKSLKPPRILGVVDGLEAINDGLERMRRGEISGGRLVAKTS
ncbi:oxidoreductase [Myriangium duriaei CBS 260.36]|uniref:Oxidoreductase n=1 Tax=Myriangium duriaei CBS 260.36 TaxID=1168546 RepID=A0A9P4IST4_9PEZI|nr:oxidoreductase [Myriangium duriaei CBS 260.36]